MSCGPSEIIWLSLRLLVLTSVTFGLEWLQKPTDISIQKGGNARFNCSVRDKGDNFVTWTKSNGGTLYIDSSKITTDTRYSMDGEFNLVIRNVSENDEADYTCTVQNLGIAKAHLTVLVPPGNPSLSVNYTRPSYVEGDVISMTCITSGGNPAPTIQWRKNGEILSRNFVKNEQLVPISQSSSQIVITLDPSDHQAQYTCVVFNSLNQNQPLTVPRIIEVQYSPRISFGQYSPLVLLKDTSAVLTCNVNANPSVSTVTWRKDGSPVSTNSPTIPFNNVSESIKGSYSCTAFNIINNERKEATNTTSIDVIYKPIVTVPATYTVNETQTAVVNCVVQANPAVIEVKWEQQSGFLAASPVLTINNIQRSHHGDYICIAHNRLQPSGQPETIGETRKTTKILVQYKPGNAFIQPHSPVLIGQRIHLKCSINSQEKGYPEPTFQWKKVDTNYVFPTTSPDLEIASASLGDNGNYSCTPLNLMGAGGTNVILVEVYEKPVFMDHPSVEAVIPNNRSGYTFQCKVRGRPPPNIQWFKDGIPVEQFTNLYTINRTVVPGNTYSYVTTSQVFLQGPGRPQQLLMLQDIGNYTCTATSSADTTSTLSHTLKLLILFPPKVSRQEKVATSYGQTKELVCTAEAYPIPRFEWFKGTVPITAGGRYVIEQAQIITVSKATSILRITNLQSQDLGEFNCRVENDYGLATKTIVLVVKSKPEAPNNISMISKTWESVYLRWVGGFDGGEQQSFYVHYTSIPPSPHGPGNISVTPPQALIFNVTRLMPRTTYEFRVYGQNSLGPGDMSEPITVRTNDLTFPTIDQIPEFKVKDRTLHLMVEVNDSYCVRVRVSKDDGQSWKTVVIQQADCFDVKSEMLTIPEEGVDRLNISLCLLNRQDVCGSHISALIKQQPTADLTEGQVIIIGCVCAAILVVLLVILVVVICRRRRFAKDYENASHPNRRPQNVNGLQAQKQKQGIDNQGMDTIDSIDLRAQRTTHGSVPEPYTQIPHNAKHNPNSTPLDRNGFTNSPGVTRPNGSVPPLDTSYDSQTDKHIFENEMNRINAANMRGDPYYDNKTGDLSFTGTPRNDPPKYIDLPPEDRKSDIGPESGYSTAETSKPKKVIYEVVV